MADASIYSRLRTAEDGLLTALEGNNHEMESFAQAWATLQRDLRSARLAGHLTQEVERFADAVASRIDIIAGSFWELAKETQILTEELHEQVDDICASSRVAEDGQESGNNVDNDSLSRPLAPYIPSAFAWLLDNLHNPYPSKEVKDLLSQKSGQPVKLIDSWFVDARKRMGWNRIKKHYFHNKRKPLIEAATKHFDDSIRDSLPAGLELDFVTMKQTALDMYSHKFFESELASKLNEAIPGASIIELDKGDDRSFPFKFHAGSKLRSPYPSPRPSQSPSPCSPSIAVASQDHSPHFRSASSAIPPPRKRCRSEDAVDATDNDKNHKRARHEVSSPATPPQIGLPSPASSQADLAEQHAPPVESDLCSTGIARPAILPKRGRRRSGSETQLSFSYPSGHSRLNRLQTVSTPVFSSSYQQTEHPTAVPIPITLPATTPQLLTPNSTHSNPQPIDQQPTVVEASPSQEILPRLSYDLPSTATLDPPDSTQLVDLYSPVFSQDTLSADPNVGGLFSDICWPPYNETHYPLVANEELDMNILKDLLDCSSTSGVPSLEQCGTSLAPIQTDISAAWTSADLDFNPLYLNPTSLQFSLPEFSGPPALEPIFSDGTLRNQLMFQASPTLNIAKTAREAEIENLRKQQDLLQARIQSLESQRDDAICV